MKGVFTVKKAEMQIVVFESIDILTTSGNGGSAGHTLLANMSQSAYQQGYDRKLDGHNSGTPSLIYDANGTYIGYSIGTVGNFYHYQLRSGIGSIIALQECNDESHHAN